MEQGSSSLEDFQLGFVFFDWGKKLKFVEMENAEVRFQGVCGQGFFFTTSALHCSVLGIIVDRAGPFLL